MHKQLLEYIQKSIEKGYSIEQIRSILVEQGWSAVEINEALLEAQEFSQKTATPATLPTPPKKFNQRYLKFAVIGIFLLILIGGALFFLSRNEFSNIFIRIDRLFKGAPLEKAPDPSEAGLVLSRPNGNETILVDELVNIEWEGPLQGTYNIGVRSENGASHIIVENYRVPIREYDWKAGQVLVKKKDGSIATMSLAEGRYKIYINEQESGFFDESDDFFSFVKTNPSSTGRDARRIVDIAQIRLALELYYEYESGQVSYPSSLDVLAPSYMPSIPLDPLDKRPYVYKALPTGCAPFSSLPCSNYHIGAALETFPYQALDADKDFNSISSGGFNGVDMGSCETILRTGRHCYDQTK